MKKLSLHSPFNQTRAAFAFCVALAILSLVQTLPAQTFKTLVNFDDTNGAFPYFVVQARDGYLWGTTPGSGPTYCGTAFKMSPAGRFTPVLTMNCSSSFPDGNDPQGLILGTDGNFYGATYSGGNQYGYGTVFKVTPNGALTTLYQFDFTHGAQPYAGVFRATDGNFYGATYSGGAYGGGTLYKITSGGTFKVLFNFGEHAYDPSSPVTPLLQGKDGNFYGVTSYGGDINNYGAVFKVTPGGAFTTLYSFSGPDGYTPLGPLVQASDGNFWGITAYNTTGQGTIFKITPSGKLTTVHVFNGTDGEQPVALVQDTNSTFYGLTNLGGTSNVGGPYSVWTPV